MAKLKSLAPMVGALPDRVKPAAKLAEAFYLSPEWRAAKAAKRREGKVWCVDCGSTERLILDHGKERKDGGPDLDLANLFWRCFPCHQRKTAEARRRRARGQA